RVNGAIIDGLRSATHLPRRTWARLVALRAASEYLENLAERDRGAGERGAEPPTGAEALAKVQHALSAIRTMYVTSLQAMRERGFDVATDAPPPHDRPAATRAAGRPAGARPRPPA